MLKRFILILMLVPIGLYAAGGKSGSQSVTITDSIAVADTVAAAVRTDVETTGVFNLADFNYIAFYGQVTSDTNFANDTCFAVLQISPALQGYDWLTIDTLLKLVVDSTWGSASAGVVHRIDTLGTLADYGRLIISHRSAFAADQPGLLANTYDFIVTVWFKVWD